jgi:hypothetical protein
MVVGTRFIASSSPVERGNQDAMNRVPTTILASHLERW